MPRPKVLLSWSSGKDSAWSLHVLRSRGEVDVVGLLTSVNEASGRVSVHGVRNELLEAQAEAAGLPLLRVPIPNPCPNAVYEHAMGQAMQRARAQGVSAVAFGDLFLEDIRRYREEKLAIAGMRPLFPLWGIDTTTLAREMIRGGLRAILTAVDPKQLDRSFTGAEFDGSLLDRLPAAVDRCGERGEFHTFAFAGPQFAREIPVRTGAIFEGDGLVHADIELSS
jgi:uncharacterized protein (TIGR00290 family)